MLVILPLVIYFFYWLINHSEGFSLWVKNNTILWPAKIKYMLGCSFCFGFWAALIIIIGTEYPYYLIFSTPVITMFLNLLYLKLSQNNDNQ